jgi:hypothetical protein
MEGLTRFSGGRAAKLWSLTFLTDEYNNYVTRMILLHKGKSWSKEFINPNLTDIICIICIMYTTVKRSHAFHC